jgi:hypothetical protein
VGAEVGGIEEGAGRLDHNEKCRLRELGERHPQHAPELERLIDRLIDLLPLVRQS